MEVLMATSAGAELKPRLLHRVPASLFSLEPEGRFFWAGHAGLPLRPARV